jgi:hypothetical protein
VAGRQNRGNIGQAGLTAQGAISGVNLFFGGVPAGAGRCRSLALFVRALWAIGRAAILRVLALNFFAVISSELSVGL